MRREEPRQKSQHGGGKKSKPRKGIGERVIIIWADTNQVITGRERKKPQASRGGSGKGKKSCWQCGVSDSHKPKAPSRVIKRGT